VKRVCAWCKTEMPGDLPAQEPRGDAPVSHGICLACADTLFASEAVTLQSIIETFAIPVLVVDSDVTVSLLNRTAREILGTSSEQAAQRRGGELFDCVYAHLPGGCGRTIHCAGCALRRAITHTCQTGEPQVLMPATLKRGDPDDPTAVTLTITTVKRNELVLVRLDRVE
jgi:PAS domain-containing protein